MVRPLARKRINPGSRQRESKKHRDVPLHQQLVDIGFLEFVEQSPDGCFSFGRC
jgi:hypothetical protein